MLCYMLKAFVFTNISFRKATTVLYFCYSYYSSSSGIVTLKTS